MSCAAARWRVVKCIECDMPFCRYDIEGELAKYAQTVHAALERIHCFEALVRRTRDKKYEWQTDCLFADARASGTSSWRQGFSPSWSTPSPSCTKVRALRLRPLYFCNIMNAFPHCMVVASCTTYHTLSRSPLPALSSGKKVMVEGACPTPSPTVIV